MSAALETSEKGVNVQVAVRCRPMSETERREGATCVVTCTPAACQLAVAQGAKRKAKAFTFDKVFGQFATQEEVFDDVVRPIVDEVLEGFNCTVFAYGQTGTGKTHTMTGSLEDMEGMGIIPRAVHSIFQYLESRRAEFSVKVSYLEIYNEMLQDLLVPADDKKILRVVEDVKRGVSCQNLEEVLVHTPAEVFQLLRLANERRATAETLCNKNSSRSHSVFNLTIHIKETTPEGEDLMKTGKLNLVDLAGSECIGRSGARKERAREAGNINQSLLTLGRVITALVEHWPHVPYRDSKLTRLLQESLGGRTKTCIIATLSPSLDCLEETLSTLDYAHRAKNIKNRPEVNQRMTKRALLREYSVEIERLKLELQAAREKCGVYLPMESYEAMQLQLTGQGGQLVELEAELLRRRKELEEVRSLFDSTKEELEEERERREEVESSLVTCTEELAQTSSALSATQTELEETSVVVDAHQRTEQRLHEEAALAVASLQQSASDVQGLRAKIERKATVERTNQSAADALRSTAQQHAEALRSTIDAFAADSSQRTEALAQHLQQLVARAEEDRCAAATVLAQLRGTAQAGGDSVAAAARESAQGVQGELGAAKSEGAGAVEAARGTAAAQRDETLALLSSFAAAVLASRQETLELAGALTAALSAQRESVSRFGAEAAARVSAVSASVRKQQEQHAAASAAARRAVGEEAERQREAQRAATTRLRAQLLGALAEVEAAQEAGVVALRSQAEAAAEAGEEAMTRVATTVHAFGDADGAAREAWLAEAASQAAASGAAADAQAAAAQRWLEECDRVQGAATLRVTSTHDAVCEAVAQVQLAVDAGIDRATRAAVSGAEATAAAAATATERVHADCTAADVAAAHAAQRATAAAQEAEAQVQEVADVARGAAEQQRALASAETEMVTAYLASLAVDVSTGATPAKREYPHPTTFSATEPRDVLVARYRQLQAAVADAAVAVADASAAEEAADAGVEEAENSCSSPACSKRPSLSVRPLRESTNAQ